MPNNKKPSTRSVGLALTLVSLAVLAATIPSMVKRLDQRANQTRWASTRTVEDAFDYFDSVEGSITFSQDTAHITWGDSSINIPITGQTYPGMKGLRGHSQWLAILALASVQRGDIAELEQGLADASITPKLVVVSRATPDDAGPEGWPDASTKAWRYNFWELTPAGQILPYEETNTHTYYGNEIVETGFLSYRALSYMPDTWQFAAAMQVTPSLHTPAARSASPLSYPNFVNVREALAAMGWTWPTAGVSILTLIVGSLMFASSFVKLPKSA